MNFRSPYKREKRKLEGEIASVERAYAPLLRKAKGRDEEEGLISEKRAHGQWAEVALEELETEEVKKKATKHMVMIDSSWYEHNAMGHLVLDNANRARVLRLVRDSCRENIKWWIGVIAPILAGVTGVLGTIIGILTFFTRKSAP